MSNQPSPKPYSSRQLNFLGRPIFLLKLLFHIVAPLYLVVTCASASTCLPASVTTANLYFHLATASTPPPLAPANCTNDVSITLYAYMETGLSIPIITKSSTSPYASWDGDCIPVSSSTTYKVLPLGKCKSISAITINGDSYTNSTPYSNPNTASSGQEKSVSLKVTCTNNKGKTSISEDPQITLQGSGGNSCCKNKSCPYICRLPGQPLFWLFKKPWNIDSR